jgi:hypothetical protein
LSILAIVAASLGVGTFAALASLPPGTGGGEPLVLLSVVLRSGWFTSASTITAVVLGGLLLLRWVHRGGAPGGSRASAAYCLEPVAWGMAAPLLSLLLDPWSFHGTVFVTGFAGIALGVIGARARALRLGIRWRLSDRRAMALLAALSIGIPTALVLPGPPWFHPLSGDEPHYLVTARSLWIDHDVDVANDYADHLTTPFWYGDLSPHAKPGADHAQQFPIHGSGLSAYLAPWYGLGRGLTEEWFNVLVRFAMSLWLAAAATALYFLLRDLAGRAVALPGTLLAVLTLPLVFAGAHLFPAVPVFALSCGAYVLLRGGSGADGAPRGVAGPGGALLAGLMLACLPWLHFKFFGLMAAVGGVGAWLIWKQARASFGDGETSGACARRRRNLSLAALFTPLVLTSVGHVAFTWALYRRLSPLAIHVGADPTLRATAEGDNLIAYVSDPIGALTTAVGYFLDQREGLLFYAPQYLLAVAGFAWLWRRRRTDTVAMLLALVALVGPYALAQETGHWAPPARPLTGVLWILGAAMGIGLALPAGDGGRGRLRAALRGVLVAWGAGATVLLLPQPDLLYHDYNVGRSLVLLRYGAPGLPLSEWAPLWLGPDAVHWGISLVGLALIIALGVLLWRWGTEAAGATATLGDAVPSPTSTMIDDAVRSPDAHSPAASPAPPANSFAALRAAAGFVAFAALLMLAHNAFVPLNDLDQSWTYGTIRFWRPQSPPTRAWGEPEGLWTGGFDTVDLLLSSREPIDQITFEVSALARQRADIQLGRDRQSLHLTPDERGFIRLRPGPGTRWNGEYFYPLQVVAHGGIAPTALGLADDGRGLGVLLRVFRLD